MGVWGVCEVCVCVVGVWCVRLNQRAIVMGCVHAAGGKVEGED